jgi:hypothetical protein
MHQGRNMQMSGIARDSYLQRLHDPRGWDNVQVSYQQLGSARRLQLKQLSQALARQTG